MTAEPVRVSPRRRGHAMAGVAVAALLAAALLWWTKWAPYATKIGRLSSTRQWASAFHAEHGRHHGRAAAELASRSVIHRLQTAWP